MPGYDNSELVKMRDYRYNYRTLNAWECFEAEGKFCHDKNHESMVLVTGSSNYGHGVCCKPDFESEHCNSNSDHFCSEPVSYLETKNKYKSILTDELLNHQMFAFLPKTSPYKCGISNENSLGFKEGQMKLIATGETQTISLLGEK